MEEFRIKEHPVLGTVNKNTLIIYFEGNPIEVWEDDTIASGLMSHGIRVFRTTERFHSARGIFCAIGRCSDCMMIVDGKPNVRTCITKVRNGMQVQIQHGLKL